MTLLDVQSLRITYGGVVAADDVSLQVEEGKVVGLIGPNGAGKTSMIDALTGYTSPSGGKIIFDGQDITKLRAYARARRGLARTFQSVELFDDLSIEDNLFVASERVGIGRAVRDLFLPIARADRTNVDWALGICGLGDVATESPAALPHGRRKLVGVARAIASRPRLVLLDEPAAGLDTDESEVLGQHLRELPGVGVTVLLVDHDMGLVLSVCDEVYVLDFGRLIAHGTPDEIRADEAVITAYLGSHGKEAESVVNEETHA
jgi:branched-chain amino acid transport system ATP-binding protein